jgi:uncharacterized protein (TIGR02246 family)
MLCFALGGLIVSAACAPAAPAPDAPDDVKAVGAVRDAFAAAYNSGNADAFVDLYTADAVSEPNHSATLVGRDAIIESHKQAFEQATLKVALKPEETRTWGTVGYDRGTYTVTATIKANGSSVTTEGRYLVIVVKDTDGKWKVRRDLDNVSTPMTPPVPVAAPAAAGSGK